MIRKYLRYLEFEKKYSDHTLRSYETAVESFQQHLEQQGIEFKDAKGNHARAWVVELGEKNNSPNTVHARCAAVSIFYKWLIREGKIGYNPFDLITKPKKRKKLPEFVTNEIIDQLLDGDYFQDNLRDLRARFIVEILYMTGIRSAELINLRVSDYNKKEHYIKVTGKGDKQRIVPFNEALNESYAAYMRKKVELKVVHTDNLIVNDQGRPFSWRQLYNTVKEQFAKVSQRTDITPHTMRHSYGAALINNGANIFAIQKLMGHEQSSTTERYTDVQFEYLKKQHSSIINR